MTYQTESMWSDLFSSFLQGFSEGLSESLTNTFYKNIAESNKSNCLSPWHQLMLPLTKEENDNFFKQLVRSGCGIQISEYRQRSSNTAAHQLKFAYLNYSQFFTIENMYFDDVGLTIRLNSQEEYLYEWDILKSFQIKEENNYLTINTNLFRLATTIEKKSCCWLLYSFFIIYSTRASILCGSTIPDILTSVPGWAITQFKTIGMEENICKLMGSNGLPTKQFIDNCINFRNAYLYPINSFKK